MSHPASSAGSLYEKEITVGLLLETIDDMQDYINELLAELNKAGEDKARLQELEKRNKDLEQALVEIRSFNGQHNTEPSEAKELTDGHDLLGRRGKILVLGATALDVKTMNGIAMLFGKKDKDVRLTDEQLKEVTNGMSKKERREFERRQDELRREREEDRLLGWLEFEDELDDM